MPLDIDLWGTRGSIPTPGAGTIRYGGNTPCVTVRGPSGRRLILDAGTGIRALGRQLERQIGAEPEDLTILLSHTHWDHIQGLPFFAPLYRRGYRIRFMGPGQPGQSLESVIRAQMTPAVFPVPITALEAEWSVTEIAPGPVPVNGFEVACTPLCHSGIAFGYRIGDTSGSMLAYLTDNELGAPNAAECRPDIVRFLRGVDTLIHDAMYFESEGRERIGWGHSTAVEAVELAIEAGVRRLVLFHHAPEHDDDALERLLREAEQRRDRDGSALEIALAVEGATISC